MINKETDDLFKETIEELKVKFETTGDSVYETILNQIVFVYDCMLNNKNLITELGGKKLNFSIVASRNLGGPDELLNEKICRIGVIAGRL